MGHIEFQLFVSGSVELQPSVGLAANFKNTLTVFANFQLITRREHTLLCVFVLSEKKMIQSRD